MLKGSGAYATHPILEIWCSLVRFGLYLGQIESLKIP